MHYLLTPLEQHYDLGFGSLADSFKDAAEKACDESAESQSMNYRIPSCFLYRHSIELYLKSAIIILHRRFNIPYGEVGSNAQEPHIRVGAHWRPLYVTHSLGDLYAYFRQLFSDHQSFFEHHTQTNWAFPSELDQWILDLEAHDRSSTYFRYPASKSGANDGKMSVMSERDPDDIITRAGEQQNGVKAFLLTSPHSDEIAHAYMYEDAFATAMLRTLQKTAQLFHDCHAALRGELTGGW